MQAKGGREGQRASDVAGVVRAPSDADVGRDLVGFVKWRGGGGGDSREAGGGPCKVGGNVQV